MRQLTQKSDSPARRRVLAGLGALGLMAPVMARPATAQVTKNCIKNDQVTERAGYSVSLKSAEPSPEASLRIDVRPSKTRFGTLTYAKTPEDKNEEFTLFISKTRLTEDKPTAWNLWALDMPLLKDEASGDVAKEVYVTGKFGSKKAAHRLISFVSKTSSASVQKGDIVDTETAAFQLAPAGVATRSLATWLSDGKKSGSLEYHIARKDGSKSELTLKYKKKDILAAVKQAEAAEAELRALHKNEKCEPLRSGCFLTTAACNTVGLADDCWELRTLRSFRDGWLSAQMGGKADIGRYYKLAPTVVRRVNQTPKAARVWLKLYWRTIVPSALLAHFGFNRTAHKTYTYMMIKMRAV